MSKGSDQTVRMRRLVWGFAGRTYNIVGNLMPRLIWSLWYRWQAKAQTSLLRCTASQRPSLFRHTHIVWKWIRDRLLPPPPEKRRKRVIASTGIYALTVNGSGESAWRDPYFRGDWLWNNFYGYSPPPADSGRLLSVVQSSLPKKKCG